MVGFGARPPGALAAVMTLADDAVAVRRTRARGVPEAALRRQLASVPTPRMRRFIFVRRVTIRAQPDQIGRAMEAALARLSDNEAADVLSFADLPALAVACARAALSGGLSAWHWRTLGLPRMATPGEAVAALLTEYPRDAGSAVAALAGQGLLTAVWRTMPDQAAGRLTLALLEAAGFAMPAWPADTPAPTLPAAAAGSAADPMVVRAATFWRPVLAGLPPRAEAVRAAAVLSLLRWSPNLLRQPGNRVWPGLLADIHPLAVHDPPRPNEAVPPAAAARPVATRGSVGGEQPPANAVVGDQSLANGAAPAGSAVPASEARPDQPRVPHGEVLATGWGGVLFLINALRRLSVEAVLDAEGPAAPTGWRLLLALATAYGLPGDEPLALFLARQDLETTVRPELLAHLLDSIEALYRPDGPWPLPLAQFARLRATETHLDLDLDAAGADLAVRLAGLDFDPGWVPWLGRVVAFHYPAMPTHQRRAG
jgi:hypothetical protein